MPDLRSDLEALRDLCRDGAHSLVQGDTYRAMHAMFYDRLTALLAAHAAGPDLRWVLEQIQKCPRCDLCQHHFEVARSVLKGTASPASPDLREVVAAFEDAVGACKWGAVTAGERRISPDGAEMFRSTLSRVKPVLDAAILALTGHAEAGKWRGPWKCERCGCEWDTKPDKHEWFDVPCGPVVPHERRKGG